MAENFELTDLPESTKTPCNECPWWRESWAGHLGPYNAMQWTQLAHSDQPIACHLTITQEYSWEQEGLRQCAGAAIYRANVCKSPRNPEVVVLPADREAVFASSTEFVDHHESSSWDG